MLLFFHPEKTLVRMEIENPESFLSLYFS